MPESPGQPEQKRPTSSLQLLAYVNIIVGVAGLFSAVVYFLARYTTSPELQQLFVSRIKEPWFETYMLTMVILGAVLAPPLIWSGIGLLRFNRAARTFSLGWGIAGLVFVAIYAVIHVGWVFPAMERSDDLLTQMMGRYGNLVTIVLAVGVGVAYSVWILWVLTRDKVRLLFK